MNRSYPLPPNPYFTSLDYDVTFDMASGLIKIDVLKSVVPNPSGIIGIKIFIDTPLNSLIGSGTGYAFVSSNLTTTWTIPIPKIINTFAWGVYKFNMQVVLDNGSNPDIVFNTLTPRAFNLCAIEDDDIKAIEGRGQLKLTTDCFHFAVRGSGLSGYAYKKQPPVSEVFNITHYFPSESGLAPQKNIAVLPYVVDAYAGDNKASGTNTATYDFDDNFHAIVKWSATTKHTVVCDLDYDALYCAVDNVLHEMRSCNSNSEVDYCQLMCEVNPLLWAIKVGNEIGRDVDHHVQRVEKLLNIQCRCNSCAGVKIGPSADINCPQVKNAIAVVSVLTMTLSFDTTDIHFALAKVRIAYRPMYTQPGGQWTEFPTLISVINAVQNLEVTLISSLQMQVRFTVEMADGTACNPLIVSTNDPNVCPEIRNIHEYDGTPVTTQPATTTSGAGTTSPGTTTSGTLFTAYWGVMDNPTPIPAVASATHLGQFPHNTNPAADYRFNGALKYLWAKIPATEPKPTSWYGDPLNNGSFGPSEAFADVVSVNDNGVDYWYIVSNYKTTQTGTTIQFVH